MKNILFIVAAATLLAISANAQKGSGAGGSGAGNTNSNANSSTQDPSVNPRLWQAKFSNGFYMVRLDRLCSVSKQEYIANGTARVVEVNIGDLSNEIARFYYLEPVGKDSSVSAVSSALDRAQTTLSDLGTRVSPSAGKMHVVKDYPTSTHAHTIEYVVQTEDTINALFASIQNSFNLGQGAVWVCPDP